MLMLDDASKFEQSRKLSLSGLSKPPMLGDYPFIAGNSEQFVRMYLSSTRNRHKLYAGRDKAIQVPLT